MQQEPHYRTITLTEAPPVRIREDQWPVIAQALWSDHDGQVRSQANRTWDASLRVRQHTDGRAIVYGYYEHTSCGPNERDVAIRVGRLVAPTGDLIAAISATASELRCRLARDGQDGALADRLRDEAIADLPPTDLTT